jgi:hypothetical protein
MGQRKEGGREGGNDSEESQQLGPLRETISIIMDREGGREGRREGGREGGKQR